LVEQVVNQLVAALEVEAIQRAREAVVVALGNGTGRRPGRPPKLVGLLGVSRPLPRRPKQLCPVPGCTSPAAPVFGMVCAKHKDIPKAKIKEYREARRKAKEKAGKAGRGAR
jgi:hypothetical protein